MHNPFSLAGKSILVTGASSGIGKSIAIECSKMGAKLIILGRNEERLRETYNELEGDNHQMYSAELTSKEEVKSVLNDLPLIDGLVNAAGILKRTPFKLLNLDMLEEVMKVNFLAPAMFTKELLHHKKIGKGASIVFISSISGNYCSSVGNTAYSSSKGALNALSENIALELSARNIRVNTVNPGMIATDMLYQKSLSEEQIKEDLENYPLKRYGKPEDVAYAVIYLLSEASSWVTGSSLLIDGGFTLK
ncbi:NAD(P)-dependent dehydrogenase, short-chain alcohol dehydrogenase family [Chryseobacterium arachidis]|uniref:NAD(P)-dependent dehydrogenase, short-chain alcohol dehydrogenase family n=1 Tax=Chryseobacterium arachidis TaxID=1416778 RepID=A0A1M5M7L1_9FLAO|nr:SDR family oxidoreductase [Chryseobacterium arachidis]SHG73231.1 NAD(P)-dependent dehydrogenase, short-chain alcohol dehydrogenase family [Chryseobacterium arachidis]